MPNRLAEASSPYLLQHKDNPVDWHEWGDDAFDEARERDVPLLLSVGYAACHWCHVMAHESFEDPETAEEMNRLFVNVKVDREERPDVDSVYMESVQAMTGQGGWPMTVWLDHDGRPFFAGTYFPNEPRHGMASFRQVLDGVSSAWKTQRDQVEEQASQLVEAISRELPPGQLADETVLRDAYELIANQYDAVHGGFGGAPKFPQQPVLEFLLRIHRESWAPQARSMLELTLDRMAAGGIHDQIGGGFARYSVDGQWLVPHFEKMLYDNAQLARLYLWCGIEFDRADYLKVARSTLDYLLRDLCHPDGGFFSSEDADSEGVEGKFYVWSAEEIRHILGGNAEDVIAYFGVTSEGNFEGANILNIVDASEPPDMEEARRLLLEARAQRVRPGLDDKVIAGWNGLAIRALAEAGAALNDRGYLDAARNAAEFVLGRLIVNGQLMRSWRGGRTTVTGFLEDHAAMAAALYSLHAATGEIRWYQQAERLTGRLDLFANPDGGFYATDGDWLIKRPTDNTDNPLPSGNALAAEALFWSGLLTGDQERRSLAESALGSVGLLMERYPTMVGHHLAVSHSMSDSRELAIVGPDHDLLADVYWEVYRPNVGLARASAEDGEIPLLRDRYQTNQTLAYLCRGFVCDLPTTEPQVLREQLDGR